MKGKRNNLVISFVFFLIIIVMGNHVLFAAQVPRTEKEIPVFTAAVRDMDEESVLKEQMGWEGDPGLRSAVMKFYKSTSSPEEVFDFYLRKIGGKEGMLEENPQDMEPGSVSAISYELEFYTDEDFEDYFIEDSKHPGTWMKQDLTKSRKPYQPGKWIKEARFNWYNKEINDDLTTFYVIIQDNSFEFSPQKYQTATHIQVQVTTAKSETAMRDESDEDLDSEIKTMSAAWKNTPPSEKDLGVPIYPGAKFDADNSAGMSAGNDYIMYIYLSKDQPSKVVVFYEQQIGIKAEPSSDDQYMIPLKGQMPVPDEGISIQPNTMFPGGARTVISIQKMIEK